jgi:hypothetical protein
MLVLVAVNTSSKRMLVGVLSALGAAAGCGGHPLPLGGDGGAGHGGASAGQSGSAGQTGAAGQTGTAGQTGAAGQDGCGSHPCGNPAGPCEMLLDEKSCSAHPECLAEHCSDCRGGQTFVDCTSPDGPMVECGPCPPDCSTLNETSCKANSYCHPGYCADCSGAQKFTACLGPNEAVACPGYNCPSLMPAPCATLDEASCNTVAGCKAYYCPTCDGGQTFATCSSASNGGVGCSLACPAPTSCADVTTQAACDARTDCHSVFGACFGCSCPTTGCPVVFTSCADGAKADCSGPKGVGAAVCMVLPPGCGGAYVTSYTTDCYEGCVLPTECAP